VVGWWCCGHDSCGVVVWWSLLTLIHGFSNINILVVMCLLHHKISTVENSEVNK